MRRVSPSSLAANIVERRAVCEAAEVARFNRVARFRGALVERNGGHCRDKEGQNDGGSGEHDGSGQAAPGAAQTLGVLCETRKNRLAGAERVILARCAARAAAANGNDLASIIEQPSFRPL